MKNPTTLFWLAIWLTLSLMPLGTIAEAAQAIIKPTSVGATRTASGYPVSNAFDGNLGTAWNAGAAAPQAIYVDLGGLKDITVKVTLSQNPAGNTHHILYAGATVNSLVVAQEIKKVTQDGETLTFGPMYGVGAFSLQTVSSPSFVGVREISIVGAKSDCSVLKHFGYFATSNFEVNPSAAVSEVAPFSDTVWIESSGSNTNDLIGRIQLAKASGMKSIVGLYGYFFNSIKGTSLRSDYVASWNAVAAALKPYENDILAFYPVDEPYLRSWNANKKVGDVYNMRIFLDTIGTLIKKSYPTKPIGVIFGSGEFSPAYIGTTLYVPKTFDWLGFDCYGDFYNCDGYGTRVDSLMLHLYQARTSASQKLFLVPPSFLYSGQTSSANQVVIAQRMRQYLGLAVQYKDVLAGVFPFLYHSISGMVGAQSLSIVKADFARYGQCVKESTAPTSGRTPSPSPSPSPSPAPLPRGTPNPRGQSPAPAPRPTLPPGAPILAPIIRYYRAATQDLYYTKLPTAPPGFVRQGAAFFLYPSPTETCTIKLNLCYTGSGRHYVGAGCGGDTVRETLGYSCWKNDDGKMKILALYQNPTTRSSYTGLIGANGQLVEATAHNYIVGNGMKYLWPLWYAH